MKIFKYIILLLLLAFFALSVFVATQKGDFDVERSRVIMSPKATVFNYVNDYRNWENFGSWKTDDPQMQFSYPGNTIGKGGSYSWKGAAGDGKVVTVGVKEDQTILQKMDYNGSMSNVYWTFKDTTGGTKVTWRSKGTMNFGFKIYTAFNGGAERIIGGMYERSLQNLNKSVDFEISTYNIKIVGRVKKLGTFYLQQRFTSKIENVPKNLRIMIPKIIRFFSKNKIEMSGRPFVIYHSYDTAKGLTDMSVCMPVKEEIFTSHGSDITPGKLEPFQAVKATLTGDYSHIADARNQTLKHMIKKNHPHDTTMPTLEIYTVSSYQEKHPSKWKTDIYMPVKPKVVAPPKPKPRVPVTQTIPVVEIPTP